MIYGISSSVLQKGKALWGPFSLGAHEEQQQVK